MRREVTVVGVRLSEYLLLKRNPQATHCQYPEGRIDTFTWRRSKRTTMVIPTPAGRMTCLERILGSNLEVPSHASSLLCLEQGYLGFKILVEFAISASLLQYPGTTPEWLPWARATVSSHQNPGRKFYSDMPRELTHRLEAHTEYLLVFAINSGKMSGGFIREANLIDATSQHTTF